MTWRPVIEALGWAFLDFIWQGLLVWAGTAAALQALRGPRLRYAAACGGLALCLALPVAGVLTRLPGPASVATLERAPRTAAVPAAREPMPARVRAAVGSRLPLVVLVWALGSSLLALRLALGLVWVGRLGRRGARAADAVWKGRMERLAAALGVARRIDLKVSAAIDSPLSFGWWRPVILLPAALVAGMDPLLLEALLAHELAHVRRFDYLANLLQTAVETLLFYHPGVWWISGRIRAERELICDELAAGALGEPRRLVLALTELDLFQLSNTQPAQAAHGGNLMNRIRRLIQPEPRPMAWKLALAIAGFTTLCGASAALARAQAEPKKQDVQYAIVSKKKDGITRSGPGAANKELWRLRAKLEDDFFWFRSGGKDYVVSDPALVARARALHQPMEELGGRMGALGGEMGEVGRRQGDIGRQQGDVGRKQGEIGRKQGEIGRQMGEIGRQQGVLGTRMEKVERQLDNDNLKPAERKALEKQLAELEASMHALDKKMEALEAPMEALGREMEEAARPMEGLEQKMEEAGKPMKELEARMKELSAKMDVLSREADAGMKKLADEALASGKARPAGTL